MLLCRKGKRIEVQQSDTKQEKGKVPLFRTASDGATTDIRRALTTRHKKPRPDDDDDDEDNSEGEEDEETI